MDRSTKARSFDRSFLGAATDRLPSPIGKLAYRILCGTVSAVRYIARRCLSCTATDIPRMIQPISPTGRSHPPSPLSPSPLSPPPRAPSRPQHTPDRLAHLRTTIASILRSYSAQSTQSKLYLSLLDTFHERASALDLSEDAIDKLEKDWWGSEFVAAWYGPQPGQCVLSSKKRGAARAMGKSAVLKRDASWVALHDE
ncbi:hypothetical protein P7C73_g5918, partial [Tremellales sp. Uapishka_1]